jgi:hypothetical protein
MLIKRRGFLGLVIVLFTLFFIILNNSEEDYIPKEGDFLFQDLDCGPTCDAIEAVTWGVDSVKFSHIGYVVNNDGEWKVLEAISKGVVLTPINDFLSRSFDADGNPKVWVGRLKPEFSELVDRSIALSSKYLGKDYDDEFIYNNGKYYCSELIYDLFKEANNGNPVFQLEPMTFKSIKSDEYFPVWIEYYQKLNFSIPQDSLGINPAGISRSKKIEIVKKLGEVQK